MNRIRRSSTVTIPRKILNAANVCELSLLSTDSIYDFVLIEIVARVAISNAQQSIRDASLLYAIGVAFENAYHPKTSPVMSNSPQTSDIDPITLFSLVVKSNSSLDDVQKILKISGTNRVVSKIRLREILLTASRPTKSITKPNADSSTSRMEHIVDGQHNEKRDKI
ncbi:hypothetical protein ACOME3_004522 [Neoechinorhynchus agilis]